jgi:hypothetical protein
MTDYQYHWMGLDTMLESDFITDSRPISNWKKSGYNKRNASIREALTALFDYHMPAGPVSYCAYSYATIDSQTMFRINDDKRYDFIGTFQLAKLCNIAKWMRKYKSNWKQFSPEGLAIYGRDSGMCMVFKGESKRMNKIAKKIPNLWILVDSGRYHHYPSFSSTSILVVFFGMHLYSVGTQLTRPGWTDIDDMELDRDEGYDGDCDHDCSCGAVWYARRTVQLIPFNVLKYFKAKDLPYMVDLEEDVCRDLSVDFRQWFYDHDDDAWDDFSGYPEYSSAIQATTRDIDTEH